MFSFNRSRSLFWKKKIPGAGAAPKHDGSKTLDRYKPTLALTYQGRLWLQVLQV